MRVALMALAAGMLGVPAFAEEGKEDIVALSEDEVAEAQAILADLADDYSWDHMAIDSTFGIKLDDRFWTVSVQRKEVASARGRLTDHTFGPHDVSLTQGEPGEPTWYFEIADMSVLRLIASGEVNAGTAAMQSFGSDEVGVETRDMEGFKSTSVSYTHLTLPTICSV